MALRLAVVGAGPLVGEHHCHAIRAHSSPEGGAELACICDKDDAVGNKLGVKTYADAFEMASTEDLQGIVISTPTHLHLPVAEACIRGAQARKAALGATGLSLRALLVEKPICENLAAAQTLIDLAEQAGVEVLVGHQRRHSTRVAEARTQITDSCFGALRGFTAEFALKKPEHYFEQGPDWRRQKGKGGPISINLIHDVDLIRFMTGHEVTSVFAAVSGTARAGDVEDTGAVTMVLASGAVGTLFFSDATPAPWSYEFTAQENKKYAKPPGGQKDCYRFMGTNQSLGFPSLRSYFYDEQVENPGWDEELTLKRGDVETNNPIQAQMAHFVEVCCGKQKPICSGRDGMMSLAVIMAIQHSVETGLPVKPEEFLTLHETGSSI